MAAAMSRMILIKMPSLVTCYGHNQTKDADMAGWPVTKKETAITGEKLNICWGKGEGGVGGHQNFTPSK